MKMPSDETSLAYLKSINAVIELYSKTNGKVLKMLTIKITD